LIDVIKTSFCSKRESNPILAWIMFPPMYDYFSTSRVKGVVSLPMLVGKLGTLALFFEVSNKGGGN
jgi:hypothetical protein